MRSLAHPARLKIRLCSTRPTPTYPQASWRRPECGPLGHGWHHRYDRVLWQDPAGRMNMRLGDGRLVTFEPLEAANNHAACRRSEKLTLRPGSSRMRRAVAGSPQHRLEEQPIVPAVRPISPVFPAGCGASKDWVR
ncbi:DUF6531 domain-containing protein [Hymenobacter sp.]|uniref:DUF6531 domain-containing protein n=1 Tax=Hymenobacter sp. TaxID=1898978 RepID=UPI0038D4DED6